MQKQTALKVQRDEIQGMLAESGKAATHIEQCRQAAETTPSAISEWDRQLFEDILDKFHSKLEQDFSSRFTEASIGELKQDLVASWLADCSLEFKG